MKHLIKETGDGIVFLRKIQKGRGDRSYGIEVAKLAGLPGWVTNRAAEILRNLLSNSLNTGSAAVIEARTRAEDADLQMTLFESEKNEQKERIIEKLRKLKVLEMTPIQALETLYGLNREAGRIEEDE